MTDKTSPQTALPAWEESSDIQFEAEQTRVVEGTRFYKKLSVWAWTDLNEVVFAITREDGEEEQIEEINLSREHAHRLMRVLRAILD